MSKIIVVNVEYQVVIKAPEFLLPDEILSRINAEVALDLPNARILDVEQQISGFTLQSLSVAEGARVEKVGRA